MKIKLEMTQEEYDEINMSDWQLIERVIESVDDILDLPGYNVEINITDKDTLK